MMKFRSEYVIAICAWSVTLVATTLGFVSSNGLRRGEVVSISPKIGTLRFVDGKAEDLEFGWSDWSGRRGLAVLCIDWGRSDEFGALLESGCALRFRLIGTDGIGRRLDACLDQGGEFDEWWTWRGRPRTSGLQDLARVMPVFGGTVAVRAELIPDEVGVDVPLGQFELGVALRGEHDEDWLESNEVGFYLTSAIVGIIACGTTVLLVLLFWCSRSEPERRDSSLP